MRHSSFVLITVCLLNGLGCSTTEPLGLRYGPHRRVAEQRQDAQVVDPYPLPSAGPDVTGARPQEFDAPRSEPRRTQTNRFFGIEQ